MGQKDSQQNITGTSEPQMCRLAGSQPLASDFYRTIEPWSLGTHAIGFGSTRLPF